MASFYDEALKADAVEVKETLKGFVDKDGKGSFASVLLHLADLAKKEGEVMSTFDSPVDKSGENLLELEGKIREASELADLLSL